MSVTAKPEAGGKPSQPAGDDGSHEAVNRRMHRTFEWHLQALTEGLGNVAATAEALAADPSSQELQGTYKRQVNAAVAYSGMVLDTLHHHHHFEDTTLFDPLAKAPESKERPIYLHGKPADPTAKPDSNLTDAIAIMEGQHSGLQEAMKATTDAIAKLDGTKTNPVPPAAAAADAQAATKAVLATLDEHCRTEEKIVPQLEARDWKAHMRAVIKFTLIHPRQSARLTVLMNRAGEESPVPPPLQAAQARGRRHGARAQASDLDGYLKTLGVTRPAPRPSSRTNGGAPGR